ncbi:transglycosylase SLT domain-containing protein [Tepidiforma sp.]|uniref:transglycosylase SLT domain-containing protein n=1 Tax=Tepidiforma sp. TaxID=2682230 RepID=UPI002628DF32|nr:transglycosylase SLT domain-containing protein [Tepidiforma sp.]MCX7618273.1 transglycosylase SLT domain-containing protein [Tepidiforma sp.]
MLAALLSAAALHEPGAGNHHTGGPTPRPAIISGSISPVTPPVSAPGADIDEALHPGTTVPTAQVVADAARRRTAAHGGQLTRAELDAVLELAGWPEAARAEAAAVAWCESRWSPGAVGDGGSSLGLFQLWSGWFGWAGEPSDAWMDPLVNAKVALAVYQRDLVRGDGWRQWSCKP